MVFEFTADEWASEALQAEMADYLAFVAAQSAGGEASNATFAFTELGLTVGGMESVEIRVTGEVSDVELPCTDDMVMF